MKSIRLISSLAQLVAAVTLARGAEPASATGRPAEPLDLWFYHAANLSTDPAVDELEKIWRRAAKAGYTKVLLDNSSFCMLGSLGQDYFTRVERVKKLADELKIDIVPGVCGLGSPNGFLWHDRNLAEGLPVKNALFVVKSGEARPVADPPVTLDAQPRVPRMKPSR